LTPSALSDLRRQIDRLLNGGHDGVYGADRSGRATFVMPSVAAMTGHAVEEVVGRPIHDILHHSHLNGSRYPRECCPIFAACRDGVVQQAEEVFWRKDGKSFPIEYTTTPLVQAGEAIGGVVVFRDVSTRRPLGELAHIHAAGGDEMFAPVGVSRPWLSAMALVERLAQTDTTVLLLGESGTGKELVARAIHDRGPRRNRPLVTLNCAAIPTSLVESELFGHERGAFTGASAQRIGRFEQAEDGSLFLDEIGELSLDAQAKLLRVLQEREFERVGGTRAIRSRARIIAATNRDLEAMVNAGRFRSDLYFRLSVFPVRLPPLRERREDILLLVDHFLRRLEGRLGRALSGFSADGVRQLHAHDWPGNVRELQNLVERAVLLSDEAVLEMPPLDSRVGLSAVDGDARPAGTLDRARILTALERAGWRVTGVRGAAAVLGVHANTLRNWMRRLDIRRHQA
jgi:PAS domain S-box-containing protein